MSAPGKARVRTQAHTPEAGPDRPVAPWMETVGTYIAGQSEVDETDAIAIEMERKWGLDRLRMLVSVEMREKFDRQRYLFNRAIHYGAYPELIREAKRMATAWKALDKAAEAAHRPPQPPDVWEAVTGEGVVLSIVRTNEAARRVLADGRAVQVYTLDEIAHLIEAYPTIVKAKATFPGATVTASRREIRDPLDGVADSRGLLDDPIPF
jgi:hypothetical protein